MKHIGCFATLKEEKTHLCRLKGEEKYEALNEMIAASKHIVFFGGAGVSTESGIPDFRSKDGLYNQHDVRFDAYQPEYLLSNPCLEREPKMEAKGKLDGVITPNIDGLHQLAGSKVVYEVHGSTLRNYCDRCGKTYPSDAIYESEEAVPHCSCGGKIRPDVTLYGEMLPEDAWAGAGRLISRADLLIVGGTSLTVYPASSLVSSYRGKYLVIVNRDKTGRDSYADLAFHDSIGEVFSHINLD